MARNSIEEWRLARAEYRSLLAGGEPLPRADEQEEDSEVSEIRARFRRVHPAKRPVEIHTIVFVQQKSLLFGARANPPRLRRPVLVLRCDSFTGRILGAPMTTADFSTPRALSIPHDSDGLLWNRAAWIRNGFLWDTPEFVELRDVRRKDRDSPVASVVEPLLASALNHVFIPAAPMVH